MNQNITEFSGANVPISEAARIMKKDKNFIRIGIQEKWLPIGVAIRKKVQVNIHIIFLLRNYMSIQVISIKIKCTNRKFVHFSFF